MPMQQTPSGDHGGGGGSGGGIAATLQQTLSGGLSTAGSLLGSIASGAGGSGRHQPPPHVPRPPPPGGVHHRPHQPHLSGAPLAAAAARGGGGGGGPHSRNQQQQQPRVEPQLPVTPAIWVVLWSSATAGFLSGSVDALALNPAGPLRLLERFFSTSGAAAARYVETAESDLCGPDGAPTAATMDCMAWCTRGVPSRAWFVAVRELSSAAAAMPAAWVSRLFGRRVTMLSASVLYLLGMVLQASAFSWGQLVAGNMLTGVGIALMAHGVYVEDAEVAPTRWRGAFMCAYPIGSAAGLLSMLVILNAAPGLVLLEHGWRVVMVLCAWPSVVLLAMMIWFPETPSSLVQRGRLAEARDSLRLLRGPLYDSRVDAELMAAWAACGRPSREGGARARLMLQNLKELAQPRHVPPLIVALLFAVFREVASGFLMTGPVLDPLLQFVFSTNAMLVGVTLAGAAAVVGGVVAAAAADTAGRRPLVVFGLLAMAATWCALASLLESMNARRAAPTDAEAGGLLAIFVAHMLGAYAAVDAPFAIVIAESQPLRTRAHAVGLALMADYAVTAAARGLKGVLQCRARWRLLWVNAFGCLLLAALTYALLPECRRVNLWEIQSDDGVWARHWLWRRFYGGGGGGSAGDGDRSGGRSGKRSGKGSGKARGARAPGSGKRSGSGRSAADSDVGPFGANDAAAAAAADDGDAAADADAHDDDVPLPPLAPLGLPSVLPSGMTLLTASGSIDENAAAYYEAVMGTAVSAAPRLATVADGEDGGDDEGGGGGGWRERPSRQQAGRAPDERV